ncbi:hypothetical protein RRSWK_00322 [Rhodopirellula sp. SWK7]|nr:hypothetical protein RRSWK_00322 [Rhodopirellula sp. SWK7]
MSIRSHEHIGRPDGVTATFSALDLTFVFQTRFLLLVAFIGSVLSMRLECVGFQSETMTLSSGRSFGFTTKVFS